MKLIKMQKGDKFADVHPDEVANYAAAGWIESKPKRAPNKAKANDADN